MYKGNKGITLITLLITIIILIFLLGVTVDLIIDKDLIGETTDIVNTIDNKALLENEIEVEIKNTWSNNPGKPIKGSTSTE